MNKLMIFNIGVDEDGVVCVEEKELEDYKWKGYINKDGMCEVIEYEFKDNGEEDLSKLDDVIEEWLEKDKDWFSDNVEEKKKLVNGLEGLKGVLFSCKGLLVRWGVEYDDNLCVIYEVDDDFDDVDFSNVVEGKEKELEWFNREVDESEFEID